MHSEDLEAPKEIFEVLASPATPTETRHTVLAEEKNRTRNALYVIRRAVGQQNIPLKKDNKQRRSTLLTLSSQEGL